MIYNKPQPNLVKIKKHSFKFDLTFGFLFLIAVVVIIMYTRNNKPITDATVEVADTAAAVKIDIENDQFNNSYHEFWQRFNTFAALSADYDGDNIVSSNEVEIFKTELLDKFELIKSPENNLFLLNKFNQIVSPEKMFCYLKHFDKKAKTQEKALSEC